MNFEEVVDKTSSNDIEFPEPDPMNGPQPPLADFALQSSPI